jgi:acetyl-CoA C-acetyltransferase
VEHQSSAQDELALSSHRLANDAYDRGFYAELLIPFAGLERDNNLRRDMSLEKLAALRPAFDRSSGKGTITAGNSTPSNRWCSRHSVSVRTMATQRRTNLEAYLVDAETAAVSYIGPDAEGPLMAPAHAVPRLLARNEHTLQDFDFYEIHEAFSGQVLCTLAAWEDEKYCREILTGASRCY